VPKVPGQGGNPAVEQIGSTNEHTSQLNHAPDESLAMGIAQGSLGQGLLGIAQGPLGLWNGCMLSVRLCARLRERATQPLR